ncbi:Uncharacterized protein HA466_0022300 [Hirschfeldia incana]|nr:Uncharacterized protein HA466_0022300 [Hirschfeldia incana]
MRQTLSLIFHLLHISNKADSLQQQQQNLFHPQQIFVKMVKSCRSLLILLLMISVSLSTARVLPGEFLPVIVSGEITPDTKAVVGCGGEAVEIKTEYSFMPEVFAGKFGSLVLNALPKGGRPASGPSKKSHDVKT